MNKMTLKNFILLYLALSCVACSVSRQVTSGETKVEVRTETKYEKDTVYFEIPVYVEKVQTLALSDEAFTLTLASIPSVTTNLKLVICASEPQSNGISKAYAKAAEFIAPQTPVTSAIALKTAYDNKYGAPSEGKPKVFVKYFYVNTATGEKSGEMLGVATLSSSEEDGD